MFRTENFIEECCNALKDINAHAAVREIVERTVSDPNNVIEGLGEPKQAGVQTLYRSDDLTIINFTWGPRMSLPPHDHRMWAVIGLYGGKEDNTFYQRSPKGLLRHGGKELSTKDACPLGADVIHSGSTRWTKSRRRFMFTAATTSACLEANGTPRRSKSSHSI